jgi:toxin ParE1/3/4
MEARWSLPAAEDYGGCAKLKDFPQLGRASSRMIGRRELVFAPQPYIVVYQVTQNSVEISRIFHGARDWP